MELKVLPIAMILSLTFTSLIAFGATDVDPTCLDQGAKELAINNDQVANWKATTANQFLSRGHVSGTISQIFPDHSGHNHFEIQMDVKGNDTLEIIYNQSFGALPSLKKGMKVEACGDYITSNAQSGAFPPSPDGAILHWIHGTSGGHGGGAFHKPALSGKQHPGGYLEIDDKVYGQ